MTHHAHWRDVSPGHFASKDTDTDTHYRPLCNSNAKLQPHRLMPGVYRRPRDGATFVILSHSLSRVLSISFAFVFICFVMYIDMSQNRTKL